jgi:methylase of polypeptide subunit release factors
MSKLTKQHAKLHAQACALLEKDVLTHDERLFVLEHWQEGANHENTFTGAFFTPISLSRDFAIEVGDGKVVDLCAGIGSLAFAVYHRNAWQSGQPEITCIEINPDYVAVGQKVLPEATWIVADVLSLPDSLSGFDFAIANPPFGRIRQSGKAPRYSGSDFEYKVIDVASDRAKDGVFLIPQSSSPFQFSGRRNYEATLTDKYTSFSKQTAIVLEANCGIDTSVSIEEWHGVSIVTEIVLADFREARSRRVERHDPWAQAELFPFDDAKAA